MLICMHSICVDTMSMLDQVMNMTKGATDGISRVSKQVNTSVRQNLLPQIIRKSC